MKRTRRSVKQPVVEESSSEDEALVSKNNASGNKEKDTREDSSSESDIENYLQPINKIDLSSSFFSLSKTSNESSENVRGETTVNSRLSDTSSDENDSISEIQNKVNDNEGATDTFKMGFQHIDEFKKKIEETKKHVELYNKKNTLQKIERTKIKKTTNDLELNLDISDLLALGETRQLNLNNIRKEDLHPSDFESSDEDWEEVKIKENQESQDSVKTIPKEGIQITVDAMPDNVKKKKKVDFLAAMKRRLNRIRKENQVYVHKVHVLCWIAHGNYVNMIINNNDILSQTLTLLPSEKSYPSERTDLGYLEKIVQWYKKTVVIIDKSVPTKLDLQGCLQLQIARKQAFNNKMYVFIFIALLRSLGIQTRLIMSFQVEPLRPPANELHSLAKENPKSSKTKNKSANTNKIGKASASKINELSVDKSKSETSDAIEKKVTPSNQKKDKNKRNVNIKKDQNTSHKSNINKTSNDEKNYLLTNKDSMKRTAVTSSKELKIKMPRLVNLKKSKATIPQVDGLYESSDSSNEDQSILPMKIVQIDGPNDVKTNLKKLNKADSQKLSNARKKTINSQTSSQSKNSLVKKASGNINSDTDEFTEHTKKTPISKIKKLNHKTTKRQMDVKSDIMNLIKGRILEQRHIDHSRMVKKRKPTYLDNDSDSDYAPEPIKKKHHDSDSDQDYFVQKTKVKKRIRVKKEDNKLKVISSESDLDESGRKKKKAINVWVEVFLETEEKWICADVVRGQVHCVNEIYVSKVNYSLS